MKHLNPANQSGPGNRRFSLVFLLLSTVLLSLAKADIVINELMARNRGAHTNAAGDDRADWIELHNNGALPVDLTGWHLSDDTSNFNKWTFPTANIPAGGYLVVYADSATESVISGELHANFSLGDEGEALTLVAADGATVIDAITTFEFSPGELGYPPQNENISYGRDTSGGYGYFDPSSPGTINAGGATDFVADTSFDHDRGFYSAAFDLVISSSTPSAEIYYTLDGSNPDTGSTLYSGPIPISETTCVRARAYKAGLYPTNIDTHTYIFVADVVNQSPTGNTPPTPDWPSSNVNGQVIQYGMDPDVTQDPDYADQIDDALLAIPTISLVTKLDNLFHPSTGIYVNASSEGDAWERVTSVELLNPDGTKGFQENAGLRIRGGASRNSGVPKHGFRLRFRREYGTAKLDYPIFGPDGPDSSNGVDLRCSQTPGWHYFDGNSVFARDVFARDLQIAQGQPSTRGDKYHLYLNGVYWGMYETQENLEQSFMAENHGGENEDYDIIGKKKHGHTIDGSDAAYRELHAMTMAGFSGDDGMDNYYRAQGLESDGVTRNPAYTRLLDVEALTDYMLVHYWTGELDGMAGRWGLNNYVCAFNRENPDGFKFFKYDSEWSLDVGFSNNVTRTDNNGNFDRFNALVIHGRAVLNPDYLIAFADRTHKHFFNDGIMTPENALALFTKRTDEIDLAIIGESARWGDAKTSTSPKTRNGTWIPDVNRTRNWISTRTATVLNQLRTARWYPDLDAPVFNQHGGEVAPGFGLEISNTEGNIYYTTDGSDPRLPGGEINPGASRIYGATREYINFAAGSDWKYNETGDLGTAWRAKDFDDSAWPSGPAPLGFGNITGTSIATLVNVSIPRELTFYCRRNFEIEDAESIINAAIQVHADGGAVVYINGTEAARDEMPDGPINHSTPPTSDGNEGVFDTIAIDHNLLVDGTNTIAVEVHNIRTTSGDMVLDLALLTTRPNEDAPIAIDSTTTVHARNFDEGEWSALNAATFYAGTPATMDNLVISKIHYHPSDAQGELSEFVELMNISDQAVDLSGVAFTQGIEFAFGDTASLSPGQRAVLVADPAAFEAAFGTGAKILGTFASRLSDGGERLTLTDADGSPLQSLSYNDSSPWPGEPDGGGYSLVLISPQSAPDHEQPQNWRASLNPGGDPGSSDATLFTGDPATDLLDYALGDPEAVGIRVVDGVPVFEFPRVLGADDVTVSVELSSDLITWSAGESELLGQSERIGDAAILQWSLTKEDNSRQYARIVVSLNP